MKQSQQEAIAPQDTHVDLQERYRGDGKLTRKKLRKYIPVMLVNNLSVLLLVTVDGLVLGNLVGPKALAAVNIFYPATVLIGAAAALVASGAGASISVAVGRGDYEALRRLKSAIKRTMAVMALAMSVVQIPLVAGIIASYGLDENMADLTWQYAIGIMIATPFGLVSTVGTYLFQATGNMRRLMRLSIMEGLANLALDLLFVGPLAMGPMGASLGTACANVLRCTATAVILWKTTDIFKAGGAKADIAAYKDLFSRGAPNASYALMMALQNFFFMQVVIMAFGDEGGVIKGVCAFCFSLANVMISGTQGAMLPLLGILTGADDSDGRRILFRQCLGLLMGAVGVMTAIVFVFPGFFYGLHGVKEPSAVAELSLRLFALHFVFKSCNALFREYCVNRGDSKFATALTVIGNATLPLFAFLLGAVAPPAYIWLSYLITETLILAFNLLRYRRWLRKDREDAERFIGMLSLSVSPEDAVAASRDIRRYADERGVSPRVSYRMALCMEEMVAYAVEANGDGGEYGDEDAGISMQMTVRFLGDSATFTILDDGKCIALDEDRRHQELVTGNYDLVKCIASEVSYQRVLDLNLTVMRFKA